MNISPIHNLLLAASLCAVALPTDLQGKKQLSAYRSSRHIQLSVLDLIIYFDIVTAGDIHVELVHPRNGSILIHDENGIWLNIQVHRRDSSFTAMPSLTLRAQLIGINLDAEAGLNISGGPFRNVSVHLSGVDGRAAAQPLCHVETRPVAGRQAVSDNSDQNWPATLRLALAALQLPGGGVHCRAEDSDSEAAGRRLHDRRHDKGGQQPRGLSEGRTATAYRFFRRPDGLRV